MKTQSKHRSMIGGMTVASGSNYTVYGSVRGLASEHHSVQAARASRNEDRHGCKTAGGYSDATVYCWDDKDGWVEDYGY